MYNFSIDHKDLHNSHINKYEFVKSYQYNFKMHNGGCMSHLNRVNGYQTVQDRLNSNMSLKSLCCLNLLRSGCDIPTELPKSLYPVMLKCAMYTLNSEAVKFLVENWPYESLKLAYYVDEVLTSLVLFDDFEANNQYPMKNETYKWIFFMSENAEWAFDGFINSHNNPNRTLVELDLADMPLSHSLFLKMALFFKSQNPAYESPYLNSVLNGKTNEYEIEMEDESDLSDVSFITEKSDFDDRIDDLDTSYIKRFSADLSHYKMLDENNNIVESQKTSQIVIDFSIDNDDLVKEFAQIVEFKKNNAKKCFKFDMTINKMFLWVYPDSYKRNFFKIFTEKTLKLNGLAIAFESEYIDDAINMLNQFSNVTDLSFSMSNYTFNVFDEARKNELIKAFSKYKHVKRLTFSVVDCAEYLNDLLDVLDEPLEHLSLNFGNLNYDFKLNSKHLSSIKSLHIMQTDASMELISSLLKRMPNLEIFNMGLNSIGYKNCLGIANSLVKLKNLKMLYIFEQLNQEQYAKIGRVLKKSESLVSWSVRYSSDVKNKLKKASCKCKRINIRRNYSLALNKIFNGKVKVIVG